MNSYRQIMFLDIDGVLNRAEYEKDLYDDTYSDYCLALHRPSVIALKKVLDRNPNLKIVWISNWTYASGNFGMSLNPISSLEMFSWLKERVVGSVKNSTDEERVVGIYEFLMDNIVESFIIVDDNDIYPHLSDSTSDNRKCWWLRNHVMIVNPLKSFLEDDIPNVEKILSCPIDGKYFHYLMSIVTKDSVFTLNKTYECRFDFSNTQIFSDWIEYDNCKARKESIAYVNVYDKNVGEYLLGMIVLAYNSDLSPTSQYTETLYVKAIESKKWKSCSSIMSISNMRI